MMRFLLLLALITPTWGEMIELKLPKLAYPIQVFLPKNFDPAKKHPAMLYYHGTGGRPDTRLIRHHTDDKDWIVVGMTYHQQGRFTLSEDNFTQELKLFHTIRRHLLNKHALDPNHLYMAGFSKGGWFTDLFLQQEPMLTGGAIMGAGHLHKAPKPLARYHSKKPVFIGVGRKDGNYPFGLKAVLHHRSLGGSTILDVWNDLGHSFPTEGSPALRQWLALRINSTEDMMPKAQKEMDTALAASKKLPSLEQWDRLRQLRDLPFAKLLGKEFITRIDLQIAELTKTDPVKTEAAILKKHRRILAKEIKNKTLKSLQEVNGSYLDFSDRFKDSRQSKLLLHDYERTAELLKHFEKQQEEAAKDPNRRRRPAVQPDPVPAKRTNFPKNPLVR